MAAVDVWAESPSRAARTDLPCTLAHELGHIETGHVIAGRPIAARPGSALDRTTDDSAARWLIPSVELLAYAIVWHHDAIHAFAAELNVEPWDAVPATRPRILTATALRSAT